MAFDWTYYPATVPTFPAEFTAAYVASPEFAADMEGFDLNDITGFGRAGALFACGLVVVASALFSPSESPWCSPSMSL